jgi:hypothetical protein
MLLIKLHWDFVVLHPLRNGNPTHLKTIYSSIGEGLRQGGYINPKLFNVDGRWGDRNDYTHVVRTVIYVLTKKKMVEHVGARKSGLYRITEAGQKRLAKIEP